MKIEKSKYEGYIWQSDKSEPSVYDGTEEFELELVDSINPFIIEGQLYDKNRRKSYSIKYVDGHYIVHSFDVKDSDINNVNVEQKTFLPNRMEHKLCFLQYWREETDALCEGMKVLQPAELVFIGFERKEE